MILRLALRDLRGGLAGLRLLAVCLFLGVAALAGVGSLTAAVIGGLSDQGQAILGGDVQAEMNQRLASPEESAAFAREGQVSLLVRMRAMARLERGGDPMLVELKGVDTLYPLYGEFRLRPGALAPRPHGLQVAIAPQLAERLGARVGDRVRIGAASFQIVGIIDSEPDRVSQGFALGPSAIMDDRGLAATGLVQPGSLFIAAYRMKIPGEASPADATRRLQQAFPAAGIKVEDRLNAAPGTRRFFERLGQFLALVGLSALAVAGIGVGSGVASYLDGKRGAIAMLKTLGASSGTIFRVYLVQVGVVAAVAILLGMAAGAAVPSLVLWTVGELLPSPATQAIYPLPLLLGAAYGLLAALSFALVPLARARRVPAAALLRGSLDARLRSPWWALAGALAAGCALAALAVLTSANPFLSLGFIVAVLGLLALLGLIGLAIRKGLAVLPRSRRPLLRMALANLHRPGAATGQLVVALGLGLTLFTTLAAVESNLSRAIHSTIPERSPSFFVLDLPADRLPEFRALAAAAAPGSQLNLMPAMRAAVTAIGNRRIVDMAQLPEGAWFLRGDRNITFADRPPPGTRIVEGEWWPSGYRGPPLVSLDAENARAAGLRVGDTITVSVLGREIEARIASLREIDWSRMGLNFVILFSPGALDQAPHSLIGTIHMRPDEEQGFLRAVSQLFPGVSAIRIEDVIATVSGLMAQLAAAVRAAGALAILAGIAVLVGALAATRRARIHDAVLLKVLGASRARILAIQALEFAFLAFILCAVALALGSVAGWYVVVELFDLDWAPDWAAILLTLGGGAGVILAAGLIGTLPALSARPSRALRAL